jgi:hypothetical protein
MVKRLSAIPTALMEILPVMSWRSRVTLSLNIIHALVLMTGALVVLRRELRRVLEALLKIGSSCRKWLLAW